MNVSHRNWWLGLFAVLLIALGGRILLLASGSVSFHSDEAVVGLMARHILDGERPTFFYGQAYMGSLDAWIIALAFTLFGESVQSIRIAQSALYLLIVAVTYACAWRLSARLTVAVVAALLTAVSPVLLALYSTATLGGYNETLLLGALVILLGYDVCYEHPRSWWRWLLLGLCAGIGWWVNGLILIYALPVAAMVLLRAFKAFPYFLLALAGFLIGAAPWWLFALQNDFAPIYFYIGAPARAGFAGTEAVALPVGERLIGLFFFGTPALLGLRFPWSAAYFAPILGLIVIVLFLIAVIRIIRRPMLYDGRPALKPGARALLLGMIGLFVVVFLISRFSGDPTGRYFLPLTLPLFILFGALIAAIRRRVIQVVLCAVVIGYFAAGQIAAASRYHGMTTQFDLATHIPNDDDAALIAFLRENDLRRGYSHYWVTFRLAFLSDEELQFSAALPYKLNMSYTPLDNRYPLYQQAADAAERIAYITANNPALDEALRAAFTAAGVTWQTEQIGAYTVYYDFAPAENVPRPPL
jgi:4-amino-4-deoxy-L-arabinose transferase-like glycosyltransferase